MAKEFDIFFNSHPDRFDIILNNRLAQFDISLNNPLTQCDLIIYSIPFHDSLGKINSEAVLKSYLICNLLKAISIGNESELTACINETKRCIERLNKDFNAPKMHFISEVADVKIQKVINADSTAIPSADLANLYYRSYVAPKTTGMIMTANVLGTEIHFSLGSGESNIKLTGEVSGEHMVKYEIVKGATSVLTEVLELLIQCMRPEPSAMQFDARVATILKRHRLLEEMDGDELAYYDDMTLKEIDYVIL